MLVTGATGYVGRHVVRQIARSGYAVRALVRPDSEREVLGAEVDDFHEGDVTNAESLRGACSGCAGVVHLVGVINEKEGTFETIHVNGTRHILGEAQRAGVKRFIYLSGLGARRDARAHYHQTKYAAEQSVLNPGNGMEGYCFQASVIFGPEDEFLNQFVAMAGSAFNPPWPVMPAIAGGHSYLQPVWIEDVAECLARSLRPDFALPPGSYELGGPEALTVREIMRIACKAAGSARWFVPVRLSIARMLALLMETFSKKPLLTRDQLIMLGEDGRAKHSMTEKILARPARTLWDYTCEQFHLDHRKAFVVGGSHFMNPIRAQDGILWKPAPPPVEKQ